MTSPGVTPPPAAGRASSAGPQPGDGVQLGLRANLAQFSLLVAVNALVGGIPVWEAARQPVAATPLLIPRQVDPATVIDVRQASEYSTGHLPGARNIELGALDGRAAGLETGPVVTMCGHGERAATAASVLERAGHTAVAVLAGGPPDWADATGLVLERGA